MSPADIELILAVIKLAFVAGQTIVQQLPTVAMLIQVLTGEPLTPEQRSQLEQKYNDLTAAAIKPLREPTEEEKEG